MGRKKIKTRLFTRQKVKVAAKKSQSRLSFDKQEQEMQQKSRSIEYAQQSEESKQYQQINQEEEDQSYSGKDLLEIKQNQKQPKSKSKSKSKSKLKCKRQPTSNKQMKSKKSKKPIAIGNSFKTKSIRQTRQITNAPNYRSAQQPNPNIEKISSQAFQKMQKQRMKNQDLQSMLIAYVQCSVKIGILTNQEQFLIRQKHMKMYFPRKLFEFYQNITHRVTKSTEEIRITI